MMMTSLRGNLGGPLDLVMGQPDGWAASKASEISTQLDGVKNLLWIATGASVLSATWVVLFLRTSQRP